MTTLERAKRFYRRITAWTDRCEQNGLWDSLYEWHWHCKNTVARALIRQQLKTVPILSDWDYGDGLRQGLSEALDILDTVYGRKGE